MLTAVITTWHPLHLSDHFLNISSHSHILHHGNVWSPYSAHKMMCISALLKLPAHKILRHLYALLQCKLKDTLTCSLLNSSSQNDEGHQLQSRSDNQNTVYKAVNLCNLPITTKLPTTKCGNSSKYPRIITQH